LTISFYNDLPRAGQKLKDKGIFRRAMLRIQIDVDSDGGRTSAIGI
jgi:hypothetical protein